jgi:Flp pilus assembly protein TadG
MMIRKQSGGRRRAATAVELALVLIPMVMFLFAIFEYGRYLMDLNLLNNAAREGCRYALVKNTTASIATDVKAIVTKRMGARLDEYSKFNVAVSGTRAGVATPVNDLYPGDLITVSVSGQYSFLDIIPFVPLPTSLSISSTVTMVCEGGT